MRTAARVPVRAESIPAELKARPQWVVFRVEVRDGKQTKVPYNARTGRRASSTDLTSWSTFVAARAAADRGDYDGLGFALCSGDPFAGVDLDGCRDPETGEVAGWAQKIVNRLGGYAEVSPSGTGLHVFVRGKAPNKRRGPVEVYSSERYLTVTGDAIGEPPETIPERQDALDALVARYLTRREEAHTNGNAPHLTDDEIIEKCRRAKNAGKFADLFDHGEISAYDHDDSRADQALVSLLAFYSDDPDQLDRLFRRSALYRPKWERHDYRRCTIRRALEAVTETYRAPRDERTSYTSPNSASTKYAAADGGSGSTKPEVVRFVDIPDPGKRGELVEGIVPEAYPTLLHGDGGVAKSLLALSLGVSVARGGARWLGHGLGEGGPVLYVDLELDASEQRRRAYRIARGDGLERPPEDLRYLSGLGHTTREVFRAALADCRAHDVKLLVLDSLGPALQGDAEASRDVISFFREVLEPFRAEGVSVFVIDHQSKMQAGEKYQNKSAFGSVFKTNLARSVLQAEPTARGEDALTVRVRHRKHNFGGLAPPFEAELKFSEEMVTIASVEMDAADLAGEKTLNSVDQVLVALAQGAAFPDDLAETTDLARQTVKNALSKLRAKGHAESTGKREGRAEQVRITEDGRAYLRTYVYRGRVRKYADSNFGADMDRDDDFARCVHGRFKADCDVCGEGGW